MDGINTFLQSSTIHGLIYISTNTRKCVRIFWAVVVLTGFTLSGILIYESFHDWYKNPVTTTIETRPIKELKLPEITVCPPKNTFTALNYDLIRMNHKKLDNDTIENLSKYTMELLYDQMFDTVMIYLNKLEDKNRYYNWYHGFTMIQLLKQTYYSDSGFDYRVWTSATSGNISTEHFGDNFDADILEKNIRYKIYEIYHFDDEVRENMHVYGPDD